MKYTYRNIPIKQIFYSPQLGHHVFDISSNDDLFLVDSLENPVQLSPTHEYQLVDGLYSGGQLIHIDSNKRFIVFGDSGRYYMFCGRRRSAELINGERGLERQYKGSFSAWYEKIRKNKLETFYSYKNQIKQLEEHCEYLKNTWKLSELMENVE